MEKLNKSKVLIFGIGGVGGYVAEALARSGVGTLGLVDNDIIDTTNINRQIIATTKNIGQLKTDAAKERIESINPHCKVNVYDLFYLPENAEKIDFSLYDYAVDAIDTVSGKLQIILSAKKAGIPVISSMGAGNKLDPTKFVVTDIYKTSVCPLAKVMRKLCRENNIEKLKVVYSTEPAIKPAGAGDAELSGKRQIPGSVAFVPSVAGLIAAGEVIKDLIGYNE